MKTKKILSLLIAMVMALGCVSLPAMAEETPLSDNVVFPTGMTAENCESLFGANTVTDGTNYYATLSAAVKAVDGKSGAVLYCKPGADFSSENGLNHLPVTATLTVYGNGATVPKGETFDIGNTDKNEGTNVINGDMTFTVYNMNNCTIWGAKATEHTVNIVVDGSTNMGEVFLSGTTGTLNISLTDCTFTNNDVSNCKVYSNANGNITLTNVLFTGVDKAVNLNHKAEGTQTVTLTGCTFTTCGDDVAAGTDEIPVRVLSSVVSGESVVTIENCTFSGTPTGGADILLDYGVGTTTANISGTAANVSVETENNVATTTVVTADKIVKVADRVATVENAKTPVAKIGETTYETLAEALTAAEASDANEITVELLSDISLTGSPLSAYFKKYHFITNVEGGVTVSFAHDNWVDFANGSIGENVTFKADYFLLNGRSLVVKGNIETGYLYTCWGASTTIADTAIVNVRTGEAAVQVKNDNTVMTVNGTLNCGVLNVWDGTAKLIVSGSNAKVDTYWFDCWDGTPSALVENGATMIVDHVDGLTETMSVRRGGTFAVDNATLKTHTLKLGNDGTAGVMTITGNSTFEGSIKLTTEASKVTGPAGLNVTTTLEGREVSYSNGVYEIKDDAAELPNAEVTNLGMITVGNNTGDYQFDGSYYVYDLGTQSFKGSSSDPLIMNVAMEFKAKDTPEEAAANAYANYTTDFFIGIEGLSGDSFKGDGCYLVGYYKEYGMWVKVLLDDIEIKNNMISPVITLVGQDFKYVDICTSVKDFICGIYLTPEVLAKNPDIKVNLALGLAKDIDAALEADFTTVGEYTYDAKDLAGATPVAAIGEKKYSTLQEALADAKEGDTITLLGDVYESVTIAEGKNIVLELAGFDIVGEMYAVKNNGTLTINDSVGTGNVYTTNVEAQGRPAVENKGTITINGGWFGDSNNDTADRNAINRGNAIKNYGVAVINGGHFTNVSNQYIDANAYAYAINTLSGGTTTINDAVIYGDINGLIYSEGKTIVNDGSFTLGRPNEENNLWYLAYGDVEIKGGTWTRAFKVPSWNTGNPTVTGAVKISGGLFNVDIADTYIAEGYELVKNDDGTWGVQEKAPEVKKFKLHSMNIDLEGALVANFYVDPANLVGEDYYAKIVHSSQNGDIEEIIKFAQWTDNNGFKCFSYPGLVAKNMADKITVTIFNKNDVAVSEPAETSLSKYALNYITANAGENMTAYQSAWVKAYVDMLNYGAEAQKHFSYNASNLANANLGDYKKYATKEDVTLESNAVVSGPVAYANVDLEDRIVYNAYFTGVTGDMHAEVSFTNHLNKLVTETIPYEGFVMNNGFYQLSVKSLVVADANQQITIVVKDSTGKVHASVTDSINGYLARAIPSQEKFAALGKAMAKFTTSVREALHINDLKGGLIR